MKRKIVLVLALSMLCILAMATTAFAADKEEQAQAAPQFSAYVTGSDEIPLLVDYYDLGGKNKVYPNHWGRPNHSRHYRIRIWRV